MPIRRTSSGSLGSATATRFCTRTCETSRSTPSSKVIVRVMEPSLADCDSMYIIPSTPLISCSRGVATVSAITSGVAPGYWAETTTVGGATSGYCAVGSETKESPPRIVMTIERTAAKIGRSMNA
jgi:hypothetical protein